MTPTGDEHRMSRRDAEAQPTGTTGPTTGPTTETTTKPTAGPRGWLVRFIDRHFRYGDLIIRWPDGMESRHAGTEPGPSATIQVHRWRLLRRLLFGGTIGLAEGYMAGEWDSPDLAATIELGALHRRHAAARPHRAAGFQRLVDRIRHKARGNTKSGSRRNIAYHYDLGNDFYREWLDPTMTYSSAVFADGANNLESAQVHKCRRLLDLLGAKPGETVLEIGCGWGHFASIAARERGLKVTAITLSKEQFDHATARIAAEGLEDRVDIRLVDYRDIDDRFDHVVSVEMFEAVGEEYWPAFFEKLNEILKPGGRAALQIITIEDRLFDYYRRGVDFIQRYIFPGGMLPSPRVLTDRVRDAGLTWLKDDGFGLDYARTLAEWRARFEEAWPRLTRLDFDERFRRMWRLYLAYCEGGFRAGNIDVRQIALTRA